MSSVVFNNFKKRYINGDVPSASKWHFIPVNTEFKKEYITDDIQLENYRTIEDFKNKNSAYFNYTLNDNGEISTISGQSILSATHIDKTWTKVINQTDNIQKPMYITKDNYDKFYSFYKNSIKDNTNLNTKSSPYVLSGFYYIRSKEELKWFSNRTNNYNNKLIGVLGDDIDGELPEEPIGVNLNYPFEGIFDGNGYSLNNIELNCVNNNNGLFGVIGQHGFVKNIIIKNYKQTNSLGLLETYTKLNCDKIINLQHIKNDGNDINVGILAGLNYGTIENITLYNVNLQLSGFIPEVYSVTNKSDKYTNKYDEIRSKFDDKNENYFLLNSFCINSPGNICPYIGYFAEGYYGEDKTAIARLAYSSANGKHDIYSGASTIYSADFSAGYNVKNLHYDKPYTLFKLTSANNLSSFNHKQLNGLCYTSSNSTGTYNLNYTWTSASEESQENILDEAKLQKLILNESTQPVYYGYDYYGYNTVDIFKNTISSNSAVDDSETFTSSNNPTICYNSNLMSKSLNLDKMSSADYYKLQCPTAYCQTSIRMHPLARAAYNIGLIAGANFGTIQGVTAKATIQNVSNFVGFIGGIAGKQGNGLVQSINLNLSNEFKYTNDASNRMKGFNVYYKTTPLLPQSLKNVYIDIASDHKNKLNLDLYFSAFYEKGETNTKSFKDDCIKYDLYPIFVAGGLFGRFIPSVENSTPQVNFFENCILQNCNIVYEDNYNEDYNTKRIENSFGVIAGKCDFSTETSGPNGENFINKMYINNCNFSAKSTGPMLDYYQISADNDGNRDWGVSATNSSRYIGMYEYKFNPLYSTSLQKNQFLTRYLLDTINITGADGTITPSTAREENVKIEEWITPNNKNNLLYTYDYPFSVCSADGEKATLYQNMTVNNCSGVNCINYNNTLTGHQLSRKELTENLITFTNSKSNIDNQIVYLDNFISTGYHSFGNSADLNIPHTRKARDVSGQYMDVYGCCNDMEAALSSEFYLDTEPYTSAAKLPYINEYVGIQNTFDGYTFISAEHMEIPDRVYSKQEYNMLSSYIDENNIVGKKLLFSADGNTAISSTYEYFNIDEQIYNNPRIFTKNYKIEESQLLNKIQKFDDKDKLSINFDMNYINSKTVDEYYYYEVSNKTKNITPNTKSISINEKYIRTEEITFNDTGVGMGYTMKIPESAYNINKQAITIGDYLEPVEIRTKINISGKYQTTAISSNQDYGGLLVCDTSGNNVMFIENESNIKLQGNIVSYPKRQVNQNKLMLLEVK